MGRGDKFLGAAALLSLAACGGEQGKLQIRSIGGPRIAESATVPIRIAEARGQMALGNVALALEGFRKALREDPNSIDAMTGVAACYDRMARFDLSRRHYEAALALAPREPKLLIALAASLDLQGQTAEAASVRAEIGQRVALAKANPLPQRAAAVSLPLKQIEVAAQQPRAVIEPPRLTAPAQHHGSVEPAPAAPTAKKVAVKPVQSAAVMPAPVAPQSAAPTPAIGRSVTISLPPARPATATPPARPAVEVAVALPPARPAPATPRPKPAVETAVTPALWPVRPATEVPPAKPPVETAVTVALPPARPVAKAPPARPLVVTAAKIARAEPDIEPETATARTGPRLERTSLHEVALITTSAPQWRALTVSRTQRSATVRFVPLRQATLRLSGVRLLNAARVNRLAARTRSYLVGRGWSPMTIGDAATVRARSVIFYPPERRRTAERLSAQFGFMIAQRPGTRQITVLLGRDAARVSALRARG